MGTHQVLGFPETIVTSVEVDGGGVPVLIRTGSSSIAIIIRNGPVSSGLQVVASLDDGHSWLQSMGIVWPEHHIPGLAVGLDLNGAMLVVFRTVSGDLFGSRSYDSGQTWEPIWPIASLDGNGFMPSGHIKVLRNKTLLMPATRVQKSGSIDSIVVRSVDNGRTWDDVTTVFENTDEIDLTVNKSATDVIMVARSTETPTRILSRRSPNYGRSWERIVPVADDGEHVYSFFDLPGNHGYQFLLYKIDLDPITVHFKLSKDEGHLWRKEHDRAYVLGEHTAHSTGSAGIGLDPKSFLTVVCHAASDCGSPPELAKGVLRIVRHSW